MNSVRKCLKFRILVFFLKAYLSVSLDISNMVCYRREIYDWFFFFLVCLSSDIAGLQLTRFGDLVYIYSLAFDGKIGKSYFWQS